MKYQLVVVGAGNMAEAIVRSGLSAGVLKTDRVVAIDPSADRREVFRSMGVATAEDPASVIEGADQVLLAIKPQMFAAVAEGLSSELSGSIVVTSIMAGVTCERLETQLRHPRVVRVMPNTPMLVGEGMAAVTGGPNAQDGDDAFAFELMASGGKAVRLPERLFDAVTAVSGSGPAYVFYLAEAMQQAAVDLGLGEHAPLLVNQTIKGAAALLTHGAEQDNVGPVELRRRVTSPGGTTQAACEHLDKQHVMQHLQTAIAAAAKRSAELAKPS